MYFESALRTARTHATLLIIRCLNNVPVCYVRPDMSEEPGDEPSWNNKEKAGSQPRKKHQAYISSVG